MSGYMALSHQMPDETQPTYAVETVKDEFGIWCPSTTACARQRKFCITDHLGTLLQGNTIQRNATIYNPATPRYITRLITAQKHDHICNLVHLCDPTHWNRLVH